MSSSPSHTDRVQTETWAIKATDLSKTFLLYDKPHHRLLQSLWRGRRDFHRVFPALQGLSFELQRGQTLGIIGRNGAGKSTLLQMICGTLSPSSGEVRVRGRIAALLELGTGFNPDFTGRENVHVNAAILGLSPAQVAQRLDDIIAFADIGQFIDQPVKTYSSGMYVRLAFAVVVHVDPDILVVDEALAVGDAMFQAKCMTRMRLMLDQGLTLLFISHDISAVKALCKKTLWLEHGKVRAYGDTDQVTRDYDHDWIHQANAAQGHEVPAPVSLPLPADAGHLTLATQAADLLPSASAVAGTQSVALLAFGWGAYGALSTEARANYADLVCLRVRLQVIRPCTQLVVSYHIKNRQNQHVLGGHTADRPEVYGQNYAAGDLIDLSFTIPIHLHAGDYALTLVVASIGDMARYTDASFHLWADDVATLQVAPRDAFPLSDQVEPPTQVTISETKPWVVLDDFFPNLATGFRVAEYNAHLSAFPQLTVLSSLAEFATERARYAALYPMHAPRVQAFSSQWLAGCGLAYINFLNNAAHYLPALQAQALPFVLTLYPGGGFGLDEPESDQKLKNVLASPLLQAIIVTQPITEAYLRTFGRVHNLPLPPLHRIDGVVVHPQYFGPQAIPHAPRFGPLKPQLDICYVAELYMPLAANKGYPAFMEAALALADLPQIRWHVVGAGYSTELDPWSPNPSGRARSRRHARPRDIPLGSTVRRPRQRRRPRNAQRLHQGCAGSSRNPRQARTVSDSRRP